MTTVLAVTFGLVCPASAGGWRRLFGRDRHRTSRSTDSARPRTRPAAADHDRLSSAEAHAQLLDQVRNGLPKDAPIGSSDVVAGFHFFREAAAGREADWTLLFEPIPGEAKGSQRAELAAALRAIRHVALRMGPPEDVRASLTDWLGPSRMGSERWLSQPGIESVNNPTERRVAFLSDDNPEALVSQIDPDGIDGEETMVVKDRLVQLHVVRRGCVYAITRPAPADQTAGWHRAEAGPVSHTHVVAMDASSRGAPAELARSESFIDVDADPEAVTAVLTRVNAIWDSGERVTSADLTAAFRAALDVN